MFTVAKQSDEHRVRQLGDCLACESSELSTYVDLGLQPLANDYHDGTVTLGRFPLAIALCHRCFHSQLTYSVEPDLLFRNYLYVSGTTTTLLSYFDSFVDKVEKRYPDRSLRVLDIASNDGTLLSRFARRGHRVMGIDPAENLQSLSRDLGVETLLAYWDASTAHSLPTRFEVIVAMNVLGHVRDPAAFLVNCARTLSTDGLLFVQTSQAEMVERRQFDTIYHEHHSFFTAKSFSRLAERCGLDVVAVEKVPVHGTSYLWTLAPGASRPRDPTLRALLRYETENGYYSLETYSNFGRSVAETVEYVREQVSRHRASGYATIGYGAAAKGNTLLNCAQPALAYIVDDNELKVGLLTPGANIRVERVSQIEIEERPLAVLALAWNFLDEIHSRITARRKGREDVIIEYFPARRVVPV